MRVQSKNNQTAQSAGKPARATKLRLVLVLRLIGLENGASFLTNNIAKSSKTKAIADYFRHSIENALRAISFKFLFFSFLAYQKTQLVT